MSIHQTQSHCDVDQAEINAFLFGFCSLVFLLLCVRVLLFVWHGVPLVGFSSIFSIFHPHFHHASTFYQPVRLHQQFFSTRLGGALRFLCVQLSGVRWPATDSNATTASGRKIKCHRSPSRRGGMPQVFRWLDLEGVKSVCLTFNGFPQGKQQQTTPITENVATKCKRPRVAGPGHKCSESWPMPSCQQLRANRWAYRLHFAKWPLHLHQSVRN